MNILIRPSTQGFPSKKKRRRRRRYVQPACKNFERIAVCEPSTRVSIVCRLLVSPTTCYCYQRSQERCHRTVSDQSLQCQNHLQNSHHKAAARNFNFYREHIYTNQVSSKAVPLLTPSLSMQPNWYNAATREKYPLKA